MSGVGSVSFNYTAQDANCGTVITFQASAPGFGSASAAVAVVKVASVTPISGLPCAAGGTAWCLDAAATFQIETLPPGHYSLVTVSKSGLAFVTPYDQSTGTVLVRFDTVSTNETDLKTITATCGPTVVYSTLVSTVMMDALLQEILRGETKYHAITVQPLSLAGNVNFLTNSPTADIIITPDPTQQKIAIANTIPLDRLLDGLESIIASITYPDCIKNWDLPFNLTKYLQPVAPAIRNEGTNALNSLALIGPSIANNWASKMGAVAGPDPGGLLHAISDLQIAPVRQDLENLLNNAQAQIIQFLWKDVPLEDLSTKKVDESFHWNWHATATQQFTGFQISLQPTGSQLWQFIDSINQNGFTSKNFTPLMTTIAAGITADGSTATADYQFRLDFTWRVSNSDGSIDFSTYALLRLAF